MARIFDRENHCWRHEQGRRKVFAVLYAEINACGGAWDGDVTENSLEQVYFSILESITLDFERISSLWAFQERLSGEKKIFFWRFPRRLVIVFGFLRKNYLLVDVTRTLIYPLTASKQLLIKLNACLFTSNAALTLISLSGDYSSSLVCTSSLRYPSSTPSSRRCFRNFTPAG